MGSSHLAAYLHAAHTQALRIARRVDSSPSRAGEDGPQREPLPITYYVLGNESADLDSFVASLAYASLRDTQMRQMNHYYNEQAGFVDVVNSKTSLGDVDYMQPPPAYIPVLPIPRKDLVLRNEIVHAIRSYLDQVQLVSTGKEPSKVTVEAFVSEYMVFIDDLPKALFNAGDGQLGTETLNDIRFILCDHNKLMPRLAHLQDLVVAVVDHHKDETLNSDLSEDKIELVDRTLLKEGEDAKKEEFADDKPPTFDTYIAGKVLKGPRVIRTCGSCTSLVAEQFILYAEKLTEDAHDSWGFEWWFIKLSEERKAFLRHFVLPTIMVDTAALDPTVGRATKDDHKAVDTFVIPHLFGLIMKHQQSLEALGIKEQEEGEEIVGRKSYLSTVYKDIMEAKQDVAHLTNLEIFRKDYKQFTVAFPTDDTETESERPGSSTSSFDLERGHTNGHINYGISSVQWSFRDCFNESENVQQPQHTPGWITTRDKSSKDKAWSLIIEDSLRFGDGIHDLKCIERIESLKGETSAARCLYSGKPGSPVDIPSDLVALQKTLDGKSTLIDFERGVKSFALDVHATMTAYEHGPEPMSDDEGDEDESEEVANKRKKSEQGPFGFQREFLVVVPPWSQIPSLIQSKVGESKIIASDSNEPVKESDFFKLIEGKHRLSDSTPLTSATNPQLKVVNSFDLKYPSPPVTATQLQTTGFARFYIQKNLKMSRKQVQPFLETLIRKLIA